MAFGNINANGVIEPETAEYLPTEFRAGRGGKEVLFSSCVYYKQGSDPIAGDYAHSMLGRHSRRVIKSVKSSMGTGKTYPIDGRSITPAEVSSVILKQLVNAVRPSISSDPKYVIDDVVITIPASFTDDQQRDTIEAARLAGFRTENPDGTPRLFLLEEPRAALYDFINRQERGKNPGTLIDFSSPKNILVFDLGGGTLDISLHSVGMLNGKADVLEDYAVSPHMLLGGDDFDARLQKFLIDKFQKDNKIILDTSQTEGEIPAAMNYFLELAEKVKIILNEEVSRLIQSGNTDYSKIPPLPVRSSNIYGNYSIDCTVSIAEYLDVIKPLMGYGATLDILKDPRRSDEYFSDSLNQYNIIYPLLSTLQNARTTINEKLISQNKPPLKDNELPRVDAVLLNGGMTKLFAIRDRLRDLFGFEPVSAGNPDFAVARGAVVYHYKMHLGERVSRIRNADIGIEQRDGTISKIITAGTPLPCRREFDAVTTVDNADSVDLPFYVGAGDTVNDPRSRPIAVRVVKFVNGTRPKGTHIKLAANFDDMGMLTLDSADFDSPVKVDIRKREIIEAKPQTKPGTAGAVKKTPSLPNPIAMSKYMERYKRECIAWENAQRSGDVYSARIHREYVKEIEKIIEAAPNSYEAIDTLISLLRGKSSMNSGRYAGLLGRVTAKGPRDKVSAGVEELVKICRAITPTITSTNNRILNEFALDALSRLYRPEDEKIFVNCLNHTSWPVCYAVKLCYATGRTGNSISAAEAVINGISDRNNGVRLSAFWALGHIGSREKTRPIPADYVEGILPEVFYALNREYHGQTAVNGLYALSELCDQRGNVQFRVSNGFITRTESIVKTLLARDFGKSSLTVSRYADTALTMIHGEGLTDEQQKHLLDIRSL